MKVYVAACMGQCSGTDRANVIKALTAAGCEVYESCGSYNMQDYINDLAIIEQCDFYVAHSCIDLASIPPTEGATRAKMEISTCKTYNKNVLYYRDCDDVINAIVL